MERPRIAVAGSLNMDLIVSASRMPQVGETIMGEQIHYIPGGKGANQAVGAARLGAEVEHIGAVGADAFGQEIVTGMRGFGVGVAAVASLSDTPTGIASITHTPEDNCIIVVPGANGKVTPERIEAAAQVIEQAQVLLVQLEIPLAAVERALSIARSAGVKTILNPAPAQQLPRELLQLADYVTPNETEFEQISGYGRAATEGELSQQLRQWQQEYGNRLIVTRGKNGASLLMEGKLFTATAPRVKVVDTTGAGDCLNAAFAYGLASGWDEPTALKFAVRAASVSVTRFGAQAGMPVLEEVDQAAASE